MGYKSKTTWVVSIVQLTHYKVRRGGKNPETKGGMVS